MKKKIFAGICVLLGIAVMAVPFYYHFHGKWRTDRLMEQFEQTLEEDKNDQKKKNEKTESTEKENAISEEEKTLLSGQNVIGIIEIKSLNLKYPIVEGSEHEDIAYAIGHMTETAAIGEKGNCVLCGHNGSWNW